MPAPLFSLRDRHARPRLRAREGSSRGGEAGPLRRAAGYAADRKSDSWATRAASTSARGRARVATVLDVFSRRVIGWAIADHLRASLVCAALRMAVARAAGLSRA